MCVLIDRRRAVRAPAAHPEAEEASVVFPRRLLPLAERDAAAAPQT